MMNGVRVSFVFSLDEVSFSGSPLERIRVALNVRT